jgi:hypothetical protein
MESSPNYLPCDGCGLPASPWHIAERIRRLELSTRFRPVHIGVLFVVLAPSVRPEDDFYDLANSTEFTDPLLEALDIHSSKDGSALELDASAAKAARLAEFQRRGYFLAGVSECPLRGNAEPVASIFARLGPPLLRRIRFNYRPKHIAPIGKELSPLIETLKVAGLAPVLLLANEQVLPVPGTGDKEQVELFRRAVTAVLPRENLSSGYDRIQLTHTERDLGAGGNT